METRFDQTTCICHYKSAEGIYHQNTADAHAKKYFVAKNFTEANFSLRDNNFDLR